MLDIIYAIILTVRAGHSAIGTLQAIASGLVGAEAFQGGIPAAALGQSSLPVGRDIDARAFAWGSDHWPFHERGIPAVDLWSGDYAVMHTSGDTVEGVDAAKVALIGRALALSALAVAGGW